MNPEAVTTGATLAEQGEAGIAIIMGIGIGAVFIIFTYLGIKISMNYALRMARQKKILKILKVEEQEKKNEVKIISSDKDGLPKMISILDGKTKTYKFL